jgi:hypothetical protein
MSEFGSAKSSSSVSESMSSSYASSSSASASSYPSSDSSTSSSSSETPTYCWHKYTGSWDCVLAAAGPVTHAAAIKSAAAPGPTTWTVTSTSSLGCTLEIWVRGGETFEASVCADDLVDAPAAISEAPPECCSPVANRQSPTIAGSARAWRVAGQPMRRSVSGGIFPRTRIGFMTLRWKIRLATRQVRFRCRRTSHRATLSSLTGTVRISSPKMVIAVSSFHHLRLAAH